MRLSSTIYCVMTNASLPFVSFCFVLPHLTSPYLTMPCLVRLVHLFACLFVVWHNHDQLSTCDKMDASNKGSHVCINNIESLIWIGIKMAASRQFRLCNRRQRLLGACQLCLVFKITPTQSRVDNGWPKFGAQSNRINSQSILIDEIDKTRGTMTHAGRVFGVGVYLRWLILCPVAPT